MNTFRQEEGLHKLVKKLKPKRINFLESFY